MDSSSLNADPRSLTESLIDLLNESRTDSQLNEEFISLIKRINKILSQTEFDVNNGEYIYKEHCNELRRQVQLAKETQIQQIEEITDKLMNEIDEFEKESLETVSKVNKEQLANKLNEMKLENEKWNQRLDEFKVDNQILNQLRDSLSKIAVERDNFKCLLHNKMMKFKEYKDESFVGKLSRVSLDSFEQIFLQKQIEEIEKRYFLNDEWSGLTTPTGFEFREGKILSNGDLLLCGLINDDRSHYLKHFHDVVLAVFDSSKDFKLKKIKQLCVDYELMVTSSDKICLNYQIMIEPYKYRARKETEDDKEYEESNDEAGEFVVLILNENLEKLHRFKIHKMYLIGANDSFLFFTDDSNHEDGKVSFYTWSMEYVKTIGHLKDPNISFDISVYTFFDIFGRYFIEDKAGFRIVDEETGICLKKVDVIDFCLDNNFNIILSHKNAIQYLSFNGEFLREIKMNYAYNYFLLNADKCCFIFNYEKYQLCFWNKYDENTHEIV